MEREEGEFIGMSTNSEKKDIYLVLTMSFTEELTQKQKEKIKKEGKETRRKITL